MATGRKANVSIESLDAAASPAGNAQIHKAMGAPPAAKRSHIWRSERTQIICKMLAALAWAEAPPRFSDWQPLGITVLPDPAFCTPGHTPENCSTHFSKSSTPANTQRVAHLKFTYHTLQTSQDV